MAEKKSQRSWIGAMVTGAFTLLVVSASFPWAIPLSSTELWTSKGTVSEWLWLGLPFFAWAAGVNVLFGFTRRLSRRQSREHDPWISLLAGLFVSARAGLLEEVGFRWLIFLPAVATVRLTNYLFFGFAGFGLEEWFHLHVWGPIADLTTFGYLSDWIYDTDTWAVGAAMLYSNAFFRDGHKYQGLLGFVNSWFIGMFLFFLALNYGLPAAILVHFLYDVVCFTVSNAVTTLRIYADIGPRETAADEMLSMLRAPRKPRAQPKARQRR